MRITRTDHKSVVHPSLGLILWLVRHKSGRITSPPTAYFNIVERAAKEKIFGKGHHMRIVLRRWSAVGGMKGSILSMERFQMLVIPVGGKTLATILKRFGGIRRK